MFRTRRHNRHTYRRFNVLSRLAVCGIGVRIFLQKHSKLVNRSESIRSISCRSYESHASSSYQLRTTNLAFVVCHSSFVDHSFIHCLALLIRYLRICAFAIRISHWSFRCCVSSVVLCWIVCSIRYPSSFIPIHSRSSLDRLTLSIRRSIWIIPLTSKDPSWFRYDHSFWYQHYHLRNVLKSIERFIQPNTWSIDYSTQFM